MKIHKKQNIAQFSLAVISILLISYISTIVFFRFDLTSEKRFTISAQSKKLLEGLEDRVFIKIYLEGDDLPVEFKRFRKSIKEQLDEFGIYADDKLFYEFINPATSSDKDIRTAQYRDLYAKGLKPIELTENTEEGKTSKKTIFPGAFIVYRDYEIAVNLLKSNQQFSPDQNLNNSIQALEYELTNAIRKLTNKKVQRIAFIEGHGELHEMENYSISRTLSEYYQVDRGKIGGRYGSLDDFSVVIIARPKMQIPDADKFVLDQYIMNGGKVLWLVDGVAMQMDSLYQNRKTLAMDNNVNLTDQLFRYGVRINTNLITDIQCAPLKLATMGKSGEPDFQLFPWYYFPLITNFGEHQITKYLDIIKTEFVSSIDLVGETESVKKTVLLKSSKQSRILSVPIQIGLDEVNSTFDPTIYSLPPQPVAVLLEGEFESAFTNRSTPETEKYRNQIRNKSVATKMIVISDGNIIKNEVPVEGKPYPLGFDRNIGRTYNGNSEFILNAVNYLCDDEGFMKIRLRELKMRMLDKEKLKNTKTSMKLINTLLPVILIIAFGIFWNYRRKMKYTK